MALNRANGVFSPKMFNHDVFDTGRKYHHKPHKKEKISFARLQQDDFEIIEFLITVTESGLLDE